VNDNQQRRLIVFDMDRTLVDFTKWYVKAYRIAVREAYGIEGEPDLNRAPGNTQANIIRMICLEAGLDHETTEASLAKATRILATTILSLLEDDLRFGILPGAEELLRALTGQGHALALVTGTISEVARVVLSRTELERYFPVCACGDEEEDREELLQLAIRRAHEAYGLYAASDRLVVVGDAPRDIQAGRAVGARVVAVATGHHTEPVLAAYEPDVVLPDLRDRNAALAAILGS
jgi:phosphoglycolate phosphatase